MRNHLKLCYQIRRWENEGQLQPDQITGCLHQRAFMIDMEEHMKSKNLFYLTMIEFGFKIASFPILIEGVSGACVRPMAIFP